jgi:hypothetical protein
LFDCACIFLFFVLFHDDDEVDDDDESLSPFALLAVLFLRALSPLLRLRLRLRDALLVPSGAMGALPFLDTFFDACLDACLDAFLSALALALALAFSALAALALAFFAALSALALALASALDGVLEAALEEEEARLFLPLADLLLQRRLEKKYQNLI